MRRHRAISLIANDDKAFLGPQDMLRFSAIDTAAEFFRFRV